MTAGEVWRYIKHSIREYGRDNCPQLAAAISYYVLFSIVPLTFVLVSVFGLVIRSEEVRSDVVREVVDSLGLEKGQVRLVPDENRLNPGEVRQVSEVIARLSEDERQAIAEQLERTGRVQLAGRVLTRDELLVRYQNTVSDTLGEVASASPPLTVFSLLFSAWSASAMFGAVRKAINVVWGVEVQRAYLQQKLIDLLMVIAFGLLMLASVGGTAALRLLRELSDEALGPLSSGTGIFWGLLPYVLPAVISVAVFGALYRFVPAAPVRLRDVWLGAVVAALLFELLKNGFAFYVANFRAYDLLYGSLGGILLFLTAVYFASAILLFGAELAVAMPGLGAGAFTGVSDPTKPKTSLLRQAQIEAGRALRSLVWARRPSSKSEPGSDHKARRHIS
jgi:YihY family inner membrane protein